LQLNGELVEKLDPHIGYLHRGSEKLMEFHDLRQASLYLDRLDYTSVLTQTHAYCLAVETILVLEMSEQTLIIRTLFDELARLLNHLLANSTHSLDVGSMAPLF
jgi:NADH:ubiquinone oxidoreductase subunit D